jgi:serine/threonine protein kinase
MLNKLLNPEQLFGCNNRTLNATSKYARIGNLEMIQTLNHGTTCKVKLARDMETQKEYAVKIIKAEYKDNFLATVQKEAEITRKLSEE